MLSRKRCQQFGVWKAFEFKEEGASDPLGHKRIDVHMIFDIKPDFTRKVRLIGGWRTHD
jgi:hypothetical protein